VLGAEPRAERVGVHEVRERELAVDVDRREELPVALFEVGPASDVDHLELEGKLVVQRRDDLERTRAEAAVGRVVDDDVRSGFVSHSAAAAEQPPSGTSRDRRLRASGSPVFAPITYGYRPRVVVASATRWTASP